MDRDTYYMKQALALAEKGCGAVDPNPLVGAVVVKGGKAVGLSRVIGQGYHAAYGQAHAERNALAACTESPKDATLYVTLEPCCHHGKTPPCTDAILESGISRVVICCTDPNPKVAGGGIEKLRQAGIEVVTGVCEAEGLRQNEVFFHYIKHRRPFVQLKLAMSLDGKIATYTGDSCYITGEAAREQVHQTRNRLPAIMVGIGTVLADDPLLTCRVENGRNPIRVICDSQARLPESSRIAQTANEIPTILATLDATSHTEKLKQLGVQILLCKQKDGRLDLDDLLAQLGEREIAGVLLEGGSELAFSALQQGVVQRVQTYIAPKLLGGKTAKTPLGGTGFATLSDALSLRQVEVSQVGEDILVEGVL